MRTRKISLLAALMVSIGAFTLPLTAYAGGKTDTSPPVLSASLDGSTLHVSGSDAESGLQAVYVDGTRINSLADGSADVLLKDYAGTGRQVSVYAVDYAGNRSDTVKLENPYYEEPGVQVIPAAAQVAQNTAEQRVAAVSASAGSAEEGGGSSREDAGSSGDTGSASSGSGEDAGEETSSSIPDGAFTPEGTGTIQDAAVEGEGEKQFYTITTEDGNVFYLVIDGKRDANNVYFLNGVTEEDLMSLAEKSNGSISVIPEEEACTCTEKCEAGSVNTDCLVCKNDLTGCTGKEVQPEEPVEPAQPEEPANEEGSIGMIVFLVLGVLAVVGIGYYVKVIRPRKQAEEEEEFDEDGYGDGFDPDEAYGEPEYLSEDDFDDRREDSR